MNIDINIELIKKKISRNYNNKKINRIIKRYDNLINIEYSDIHRKICYYNRNNEFIIGFKPRDDITEWKWYCIDDIKEKLINDINKEKFKMSIYYMKKKKLPDEIIYEIYKFL